MTVLMSVILTKYFEIIFFPLSCKLINFFAVVYPVTSIDMYVEIEDDHGHREKYNISEELEGNIANMTISRVKHCQVHCRKM